mgnify:CR=1 FL=1
MKFLLIRIYSHIKKIPLFFKSIWKLYKHGGITSVNISYLNFGEVLYGKNILITGGSTGIGFHIAKKCISEGANVVITGRNESKLVRAKEIINSERLKIVIWDISNIEIIVEQLSNVERLLNGKIDILVNNAGIVNGSQFLNVTEKIWDDIYSINSKGLYFLTQSICNKWLSEKSNNRCKKIINISSQGGFVGATYPYRMTKWDIAGLTQGLGIKLAPHGIIVNGIAPGIIATGMQPGYLNQKDNIFCPLNPIERFALPEEIAELALFLMSDASNFIIGQTIVCDGGYSIK